MIEPVPTPEREERISEVLQRLLEASQGQSMQIREMVAVMHGRGLNMIVVLLCLPFLAPVSIPGISIPFGMAIAFCGVRIAFWHKPWLPGFILNRRLSYPILERMVHFGCKFYGKLERVIRPRWSFILDFPGMIMVNGLVIALAGIYLSLPIPPPFPLTNTIPGFAIIFLSLGLIERDGILVFLGHVLAAVATLYLVLIFFAGQAGVTKIWQMFSA